MRKRKRRRRCPYCRELFWPDARTAWRQKVCGKSFCQASRRRKTQEQNNRKNGSDYRARQYRKAISEAKQGLVQPIRAGPGKAFSGSSLWTEMAEDMAPSYRVIFEFYVHLIFGALQDERSTQVPVINKEIGN